MQKSALLGSAHILRKVLEVWGLGIRLDWIFLPRKNPCAKFYIIIIIINNNNNTHKNNNNNNKTIQQIPGNLLAGPVYRTWQMIVT